VAGGGWQQQAAVGAVAPDGAWLCRRRGSPEESQECPPGHQTRGGLHQNEEEGARNSPRGLKRWERRRRSRSAARGGAPARPPRAAALHGRGREEERCEGCRGSWGPFIGRRRKGRRRGEAVGEVCGRPAIDDGGARVGWPFREGRRRSGAW
jgi:hypothetical protein